MFSTLRTRFGIPGVISVMALVFAMFGGAYAASNSSGGGKATASAKAKKGPRGPKGATGPAGPAGPQGPAGATGAKGDAGANGANGVSVTSTESANAIEGHCTGTGATGKGGSQFVSASGVTYACNGKQGPEGPTGPACPEGPCFLPSEATETGVWGVGAGFGEPAAPRNFPISFNLPLAEAPEVIFLDEGELSKPGCPGEVDGIPTADPGKLCVYAGIFQDFINPEAEPEATFFHPVPGIYEPGNGAGPVGTIMKVTGCVSEFCRTFGTWAVTAE